MLLAADDKFIVACCEKSMSVYGHDGELIRTDALPAKPSAIATTSTGTLVLASHSIAYIAEIELGKKQHNRRYKFRDMPSRDVLAAGPHCLAVGGRCGRTFDVIVTNYHMVLQRICSWEFGVRTLSLDAGGNAVALLCRKLSYPFNVEHTAPGILRKRKDSHRYMWAKLSVAPEDMAFAFCCTGLHGFNDCIAWDQPSNAALMSCADGYNLAVWADGKPSIYRRLGGLRRLWILACVFRPGTLLSFGRHCAR